MLAFGLHYGFIVLYVFRFCFVFLCLKEPSVDVGFPIHFPEVPDSRRGETDPHSFHTAGRSFVCVCSYVFVFLSVFVFFCCCHGGPPRVGTFLAPPR